MAQFFFQPDKDKDEHNSCQVFSLSNSSAYALNSESVYLNSVEAERVCQEPESAALLRSTDNRDHELWIALDSRSSGLRINGLPLQTGIRVLSHRDEVRINAGQAGFFSTERLARVERYGKDDKPICPRCSLPILTGSLSLRCPICGVRYHQDNPSSPCWQYGPECVTCCAPTDPEGGFRWTPEGI
jgi:hypothetical protein